jgi:hypothetical protein
MRYKNFTYYKVKKWFLLAQTYLTHIKER